MIFVFDKFDNVINFLFDEFVSVIYQFFVNFEIFVDVVIRDFVDWKEMLNVFHFNNNKLVDHIDILFNMNIVFKVEMNQQIEFVETFKTENQILQNVIKFANMLKILDMSSFFTVTFRRFVIVNDSFKFDNINKI